MAKKQSKRYTKAAEQVKAEKLHMLNDAVAILEKFPKAKFDETVQVSVHLGVDPKQSDMSIRGTVILPNGSGKKVKVLVFTENPDEALKAGAEYAGLEDMMKKIEEGWLDFDVAIATNAAMKVVRNIARVLGPRGLMPSPKSGTVTDDIHTAVNQVKAGRVEFKMSKTADLAIIVGKRSFNTQQLVENTHKAIEALASVKPDILKTEYVKSLTLSSTMSPGVRLDVKQFANL